MVIEGELWALVVSSMYTIKIRYLQRRTVATDRSFVVEFP
jgi:hypothetical protein